MDARVKDVLIAGRVGNNLKNYENPHFLEKINKIGKIIISESCLTKIYWSEER